MSAAGKMDAQTDRFVSNLIAFWRSWHNGDDVGDSPEWIELCSVSKSQPAEALRLASAVARRDSEGLTFQCLSGCVTDALRVGGASVLGQLEQEARAHPLFAQMLSHVHPSQVPEDCRPRLAAIRTIDSTPGSSMVQVSIHGQGRVVVVRGRRASYLGSLQGAISNLFGHIREWFGR